MKLRISVWITETWADRYHQNCLKETETEPHGIHWAENLVRTNQSLHRKLSHRCKAMHTQDPRKDYKGGGSIHNWSPQRTQSLEKDRMAGLARKKCQGNLGS